MECHLPSNYDSVHEWPADISNLSSLLNSDLSPSELVETFCYRYQGYQIGCLEFRYTGESGVMWNWSMWKKKAMKNLFMPLKVFFLLKGVFIR